MSQVCKCGGGVYGKDQLAGLVWWEAECPNANVMTVCPTAATFISQGWFWVSGPPVPSSPPATTPAVQGAQAGLTSTQQVTKAKQLLNQHIANAQAGLNTASLAAQQIANAQQRAALQAQMLQINATGFNFVPGLLEDVPPEPAAPERPECQLCGVEMSSYLDAYHGRDAWEAAKCSKCRTRGGV